MPVKFWQTIVRFWFFLSYLITTVRLKTKLLGICNFFIVLQKVYLKQSLVTFVRANLKSSEKYLVHLYEYEEIFNTFWIIQIFNIAPWERVLTHYFVFVEFCFGCEK